MNTIQSQGGAVAVGGNVYDQRSFHLPAAPPTGPAFVVPYPRNPLFTGRDAELARLGEWLDGGACVAVVGTGGLGKTQLAAEYAHAARDQYPGGVFWLNMEQAEGIAGQVAALAGPGGLNLPQAPALDFAGKVAAVRAAWIEPVARLLIFDNLEDPAVWREWRPSGGGTRVLITSRRQTWGATSGVELLPLQPLGRRASQELLLAPRAKGKKTTPAALLADPALATDADAICEALGDLPLALALAGAYLETTPSVTLARYRADIEAAPLARLETALDEPLPTGHEASILKTFTLSYDKLGAKLTDVRALMLLHCAAHCAPAPIPRRLLIRAIGLDPATPAAGEQADQILNRLSSIGLIEDLGDSGLRLHRLLAAFIRPQPPYKRSRILENVLARGLSALVRTRLEAAIRVEISAINEAGYPLTGVPYLPHLHGVAAITYTRGDRSAAALLNTMGILLQDLGDLTGARPYLERALAIREQTLGPSHPDTAQSLNNLGTLLRAQGDLGDARSYLERALEISEQTFGPTHPNTTYSLNNLGGLLQDLGDLEDARPYLERALALHEQILGPAHRDTATSLNNMGTLLQDLGDLVGARSYYERALAIREKTLGSNHPDTASSLYNLGGLLDDLGDQEGAWLYYERALAIREKTLGPTHPDTALSLNNLGLLLHEQGDSAEARPYYERALAICEQSLGPIHPLTATSLNNLGTLLQEQGNLTGARPYLERALAIREQALGSTHPDTATSLNNLGTLLQEQGVSAAARPYLERALAVYEETLGAAHPKTAAILVNLGALLYEEGDPTGALPLFEWALRICEQKLGPDHPNTHVTQEWLERVRQTLTETGGGEG